MSATRLAVNNKELPAGVGGGEVVGGGDSSSNSNSGGGSNNTSGGGMEGKVYERNSADLLANIEKPSRDPSPIRRNLSSAGLTDNNITPPLHQFKNKRRPGSVRSAAASRETSPIRSVSAAAAAVLRNSQQPDLQQPRPQRPLPSTSHWPSTSRLTLSRSPPPNSRSPAPSLFKRNESATTPVPLPPSRASLREKDAGLEDPEDPNPPSGMKTPKSNASPALETVVESSLANNPAPGTNKSLTEQVAALVARQSSNTHTIHEESESEVSVETVKGRGSRTPSIAPSISSSIANSLAESESESGYKSEDRPTHATSRVPPPAKPFSRRPTVMGSDNFQGRMTVETETVTSVPQVALGAGVLPGGASIRSKKSTDTIRASKKKEKKVLRKTGGAGNSNLTSKADIFAAKIAEAVDEANSSDSEETFVYESNPPEPPTTQRPRGFHHSRTPSATSIQGGPDPRGQRLPLLSTIDGNQSTRGKGMKFANTSANSSNLGNEMPAGDGTGNERGGAGSGSSRAGEGGNGKERENANGRNQNGHRSILAEESPFHHNPSRKGSRHSLAGQHNSSKTSSHSTTPINGSTYRNGNAQKRVPRALQASYEADVEGGFDERAPLMSPSGRSGRRRDRDRAHRPGSGSLLQQDYLQQHRTRGWLRTYIGCIVAVAAVILIMTGVGGFLFATTKALLEVRVLNVTGVLVSKQEIMLDLVVEAINPNAIPVTVGNMDVNLFAKSSYVGDRKGKDGDPNSPGEGEGEGEGDGDGDDEDDGKRGWWGGRRRKGGKEEIIISQTESFPLSGTKKVRYRSQLSIKAHSNGNIDEGTDPPEDLPEGGDRQTMLLGRIYSFDSALTFDASPLRHKASVSVGELRLAKPGNKTEEGGTERWERVLQHPFELIVRGVLRYQLPLSGRVRTAPIGASVIVHPDGLLKSLRGSNEFHDDDKRPDK